MGYNVLYPGDGRIQLDGGLNNKFHRSIISDNESPDCANVVFNNAAAETRGGIQKLNTTAIGSFAINGLKTRHDNTGSETMVAFANGTFWQLAVSTFSTIPSGQSVFTSGTRIGTAEYEDKMFIGNGSTMTYKYDGTNFTRHGVYPPTTTASVASNGAGVLTGDHLYKVTFLNSFSVEGNGGPATTTFTATATGSTLRVSSIPVAPQSFGVAQRRLYRLDGATYKLVTTIADNTTTTFDDNVTTTTLGAAMPSDNGVPPLYDVAHYHQNRLFMTDPSNRNFMWYTNLAEPYTVGSLNFLRIGDNTSDLIQTYETLDNSVLVCCAKSEWLVYMPDTDPANWQVVRIKSPYGTKSKYGLWRFNNKIGFPAVDNDKYVGFGAVSGGSIDTSTALLTVSTAGSDRISDRIEPDMFLIPEASLNNISAIVFKNKAYIAVPHGAGQTTNNRVWVADFSLSNLERRQEIVWVPYTGINISDMTIYNGNLYGGSSSANGFVYQMETTTYSDDGVAIDSYIWTKELYGGKGEEGIHKDFRRAIIFYELAGDYNMNMTYRLDSDNGSGNAISVDLTPGGSLWGTMIWGVDVWSPGNEEAEKTIPLGTARGKRIQFKFSNQNTINQRFRIIGLNLNYNTKGRRKL